MAGRRLLRPKTSPSVRARFYCLKIRLETTKVNPQEVKYIKQFLTISFFIAT